jgi:catechol 2,3-dioxygenase-like lactoylglutathione lyase family enzyme
MRAFYVDVLGYTVEWEPDPQNLYLTRGSDNLALHASNDGPAPNEPRGVLDHLGIVVPDIDDVDAWDTWLRAHGHVPEKAVKTHRDGARSLYVRDPEGNLLQFLWHPALAGS